MYRIAQKPEKTILKNDGSTSPSSTKPSASNIPQISNKNIAAPIKILGRKKDESKDESTSSGTALASHRSTEKAKVLVKKDQEQSPQIPPKIRTNVLSIVSETTQPKEMGTSLRLIEDTLEFNDKLRDYLSNQNHNYMVVGCIGSQGSGKSTFMSMLAGNEANNMYRQYIFRPSSRETVESCRHQTSKIWIYVSHKTRTIFLDSQPVNSTSLYEDYQKSHRQKISPMDSFQLEMLQLLIFMTNVCNTLFLCFDWFIDIRLVRELMKIEIFNGSSQRNDRKVNLVCVHNKAKQSDFDLLLIKQRMEIISGIFDRSIFDCSGDITLGSLGFPKYSLIESKINYLLLPEMKSRAYSQIGTQNEHRGEISYSSVILSLRLKLLQMKRCHFLQCPSSISELEWLNMACRVWNRIVTEGFSIIDYKTHLLTYKDFMKSNMLSVGTELDGELHTFNNISNTNKLSFYESKTRKLRDGRLKGLRNKL